MQSSTGGVEVKVAAGSLTYLAAGYLSTLLIEVVPWLKDNLTADQQQNLPIIIGWLLASLAAYLAPHTHRADLAAAAAAQAPAVAPEPPPRPPPLLPPPPDRPPVGK